MSLKIKIKRDTSSLEADSSLSNVYANYSDEDEEPTPPSATEPKRSRSNRIIKPPKRYRDEEDEVDVVGYDTTEPLQPARAASSGSQKKPKSKPKAHDDAPPPPKKKKALALSEESGEDSNDHRREDEHTKPSTSTQRQEPAPFPLDFDDFSPPSKPSTSRVHWSSDDENDRFSHKQSRTAYLPSDPEGSPPSSPRRKTRGVKTSKDVVRKKERADRPITNKDERRVVVPTKGTDDDRRAAISAGSKRPRDDHDDVDIVEAGTDASTRGGIRPAQTMPGSPKADSAPALPSFKKRKVPLPTIKKNKVAAGSSTSGNPSQGSAPTKPRPKPAPVDSVPDDSLSTISKKPTQEQGKPEVDLMDKDVYASLFKNTGVSAPRSGLDTKSKEEHRKQLDKLRQEDQARRAAQWEHTFDLRAQHDKIMLFVEKMQARRSTALYPNILAATIKNEYDRAMRGQNDH